MNLTAPGTESPTNVKCPLCVVVVEDNALDAEIILRELRTAGFDVACMLVQNEAQFLAALDTAPQLIVSEYNLPHFDGLRALDLVVERALEIPFILVSGMLGDEQAIQAIQRGADDYLLKDRLSRLGPAVRRALEIRQTQQHRKDAIEDLRQSEHAYRQLVNTLPIAMYITDAHGRITLCNDAAVALWGSQPDPNATFNDAFEMFDLDGNMIPKEQWPTAKV